MKPTSFHLKDILVHVLNCSFQNITHTKILCYFLWLEATWAASDGASKPSCHHSYVHEFNNHHSAFCQRIITFTFYQWVSYVCSWLSVVQFKTAFLCLLLVWLVGFWDGERPRGRQGLTDSLHPWHGVQFPPHLPHNCDFLGQSWFSQLNMNLQCGWKGCNHLSHYHLLPASVHISRKMGLELNWDFKLRSVIWSQMYPTNS